MEEEEEERRKRKGGRRDLRTKLKQVGIITMSFLFTTSLLVGTSSTMLLI